LHSFLQYYSDFLITFRRWWLITFLNLIFFSNRYIEWLFFFLLIYWYVKWFIIFIIWLLIIVVRFFFIILLVFILIQFILFRNFFFIKFIIIYCAHNIITYQIDLLIQIFFLIIFNILDIGFSFEFIWFFMLITKSIFEWKNKFQIIFFIFL
jgi:hypothetical protein